MVPDASSRQSVGTEDADCNDTRWCIHTLDTADRLLVEQGIDERPPSSVYPAADQDRPGLSPVHATHSEAEIVLAVTG